MTTDDEDTGPGLDADEPAPRSVTRNNPRRIRPVIGEPDSWAPPDFGNERRSRIGASIVEEFVLSHDGTDVLRELVQNEFDAGGDQLTVAFGEHALEVTGNGTTITADGWERLSVILGTGRVLGGNSADRIFAKANGIGSKNFGLRSLFLFGDQIYVRSAGQVAILDLPSLETGRVQDPASSHAAPGVRINVPYRTRRLERLEVFSAEVERQVFEAMAEGMLATIVKLARSGARTGIRRLILSSVRNSRILSWRQSAEVISCKAGGISGLRRKGRLVDWRSDEPTTTRTFEEIEFTKQANLPDIFSEVSFPTYFAKSRGAVGISVSIPLARKRIDFTRPGHFYYPLQAPDSRTGYPFSVSAPFQLDSDRSNLLKNEWNQWLLDEAASLAISLLKEDWFERFEADAYKSFVQNASPTPLAFAEAIEKHLSEDDCWPSSMRKGSERHAKASQLVVPDHALLDNFLSKPRYIDAALRRDESVRALAIKSGAKRFTVASLVRLRCAGARKGAIRTVLDPTEADYHFTSYDDALTSPARQAEMAAALSSLSRFLTDENRHDLRFTSSTLTADNELRPANELVRVAASIWEVCPEPLKNRLHPSLLPHRAIAEFCQEFDENTWIIAAADRARDGEIDGNEREVLYAKLLAEGTTISARALAAARESPVVKNHRGEWATPMEMVFLEGDEAHLLSPAISMPSEELIARPELLRRFRIRTRINRDDILAYATSIGARPHTAEQFETLLDEHQGLLTPEFVETLQHIEFLRSQAGSLASPSSLHLDLPGNRLCLAENHRIIAGPNEPLYRRLRVLEHPSAETLLEVLKFFREQGKPPPYPQVLYPMLVAALARTGQTLRHADQTILWMNSAYTSPNAALVGSQIPTLFEGAVPVMREPDELVRAYTSLGANTKPTEDHWIRFFTHISETVGQSAVDARSRRNITDAYRRRGASGLPSGLDEEIRCLLDQKGRLFSLSELRAGLLAEDDYPALARAIEAINGSTGIVDIGERTRPFFTEIGIRPLSTLAGAGTPILGASTSPPPWFKAHHSDRVLDLLKTPLFSRALHELTIHQRHSALGADLIGFSEFQRRIAGVTNISFYETITREYTVGDDIVQIEVETATHQEILALVSPRTRLDFAQLVAQAIAEIACSNNIAQGRALSVVFLPLILSRTIEEIRVYMERQGIDIRKWSDDADEEIGFEPEDTEDIKEEVLRQVIDSLETTGLSLDHDGRASGQTSRLSNHTESKAQDIAPDQGTVLPQLPALSEITMTVIPTLGQETHLSVARRASSDRGAASRWSPRNPSQVQRDIDVGFRGEELVYLNELARVRAKGHERPEEIVSWTSRDDPSADHDIRSIGEDGSVRWIEVKSTTGTDGRFEWPRREFEKALKEGPRYELWRVYKAATTEPVAKCFPNPASLIATTGLVLELGTLRARLEDLE